MDKRIFLCAKTEYINWLKNPKMIVYLSSLLFIYGYVVLPLADASAETGVRLNFAEVFIALSNSGMVLLILPVIFMVLISDFPHTDKGVLFSVIRTGRIRWAISQLLHLAYMSASFVAGTFVMSVIMTLNCNTFNMQWSYISYAYMDMHPNLGVSFISELLPENLYYQMTLPTAIFRGFVFVFLYLYTIGLIFFVAKICVIRLAGVIASAAVITIGTLLTSIDSPAKWAFPMANSVTWIHYAKYTRKPEYPIEYSYIYYAVVISVLIIISLISSSKYNFLEKS